MTSIPIVGKIVSIEVDDETFGYGEYSDAATGSRTVIEPTGNKLSIIRVFHDNSSSGVGFALSDDFNIGDIVEIYSDDSNNYSVYLNATGDNGAIANLNNIIRRAVHLRKIFSGTGFDWLMLKGN